MPDSSFPHGVRLTYDAASDVAYLTLRALERGHVIGPTLLPFEVDPDVRGVVALDFSETDGRLVGFEFLDASATLPPALLALAERVDGRHVLDVLELRLRTATGPGADRAFPFLARTAPRRPD